MSTEDACPEQPISPAAAADIISQVINPLDELLGALSKSIPATKSWGRNLQEQLHKAVLAIETLRITLSLRRPSVEVSAAARTIRSSTAVMNSLAAGGRVDLTTRSALKLAHHLGQALEQRLQMSATGS